MVDYPLLLAGIVSFGFAAVMLCRYLFKEKGSVLDPIAVSWFGYMLNISLGMFACAYLLADRPGYTVKGYAIVIVLCGTFAYTLGMYCGRGDFVKKCIPRVAATLTSSQVLMMFITCSVIIAFFIPAYSFVPPTLLSIFSAIALGSTGTLTLISLLVLLTYRGKVGLKVIMVVTFVAVCFFTYKYTFSRRPLVGIFIAAFLFVYYSKMMQKSVFVKSVFWVTIAITCFLIVLLVGATRGQRFQGSGAASYEVLSQENIMEFLGGITINYIVYEYTIQEYPQFNSYLYGKGWVPAFCFWIPRAIWPDKPVSSGAYITRVWFNDPDPPSNVANTPFGELYMNFGLIGVFVGFFIVGKIIRGVNQYWIESPDNVVLALAWFIVIPSFVGQWRGDFTSMSVQSLMQIVLFLGMAWLSNKLFPQSSKVYWDNIQSVGEDECDSGFDQNCINDSQNVY